MLCLPSSDVVGKCDTGYASGYNMRLAGVFVGDC